MGEKGYGLEDQLVLTREFSKNLYSLCLKMALDAGNRGSHIGGSLSAVDIFAVLYTHVLKYDPKNPLSEDRDRFVASKAHCILSHFSALALAGYFSKGQLGSFLEDGGLLCGHPYRPEIGLEFSGGSLGMGISAGIGMAIALKHDNKNNKVYVLLGDGECNEGSVWEGFMAASRMNLDNLTVIIDYNNMQFDGANDEIMPLKPLDRKLEAFGFHVEDVDGHSIRELYGAFDADANGAPKAIIARTVKARGVKRIEGKAESHQTAITREDYEDALESMRAVYDGSI